MNKLMNIEYNENKKSNTNVKEMNDYLYTFIDDFLDEKQSYSENTYINYKCDFNKLAYEMFGYDGYKYIKKSDLEGLSIDDVLQYFRMRYQDVNQEGQRLFKNTTLNRRISSFKSLIENLVAREKIKFNVHQLKTLLKALPDDAIKIEVLSQEDTDRCLEWFKDNTSMEIYLIAKLSVDTSLRASEVLSLHWKQFFVDKNEVRIKSVGELKGKGNKDWKHKISLDFYNEIKTNLNTNASKLFNISYSTLARHMVECLHVLELDNHNYSFHSFRKRAITNEFNATGDITAAQRKANHSNINTTVRYIEEKDYGITGIYSLQGNFDNELYKTSTHEELLCAIEKMGKDYLFLLNKKLQEMKG